MSAIGVGNIIGILLFLVECRSDPVLGMLRSVLSVGLGWENGPYNLLSIQTLGYTKWFIFVTKNVSYLPRTIDVYYPFSFYQSGRCDFGPGWADLCVLKRTRRFQTYVYRAMVYSAMVLSGSRSGGHLTSRLIPFFVLVHSES